MRKRATIHAVIAVEVVGDSEEELFENFADAMSGAADHGAGIVDITVVSSETKEIPFVVPVGAERWTEAASEIRFAEEGRTKAVPMYDGAWWWTNGHAALRCEGTAPEGSRLVPESEWTSGFDKATRETTWGPVVETEHFGVSDKGRLSADETIGIGEKYYQLVTKAVPGARWFIGEPEKAALVRDDSGRVVAVVMPMTLSTFAAHMTKVTPERKADASSGGTDV